MLLIKAGRVLIKMTQIIYEDNNLPFDIRAKSVEEIDRVFNIIQHSKIKEYHYHFSLGFLSDHFRIKIMKKRWEQHGEHFTV